MPLPAPVHGRQVRAGPVLGILSQRRHLRSLPLRYGLQLSCQACSHSSAPWPPRANPQPRPRLSSPASPLPPLTPHASSPRPQAPAPSTPSPLPAAFRLGPPSSAPPAAGPALQWGHSPAHTSSPARHAHVPVPHGLHGPKMHPAGVCGLLCQQQHLHCQPGQPAPVPMSPWLPGGPLPVP